MSELAVSIQEYIARNREKLAKIAGGQLFMQ